jgi:hypothetical protein
MAGCLADFSNFQSVFNVKLAVGSFAFGFSHLFSAFAKNFKNCSLGSPGLVNFPFLWAGRNNLD